jgi:hypothetical protein
MNVHFGDKNAETGTYSTIPWDHADFAKAMRVAFHAQPEEVITDVFITGDGVKAKIERKTRNKIMQDREAEDEFVKAGD